MKKKQHLLPCGRVIFYMRHRIEDIGITPRVMKVMLDNKAEFRKIANPDHYGRKRKMWSAKAYKKFTMLLIKRLMDHLMDSDRVESPTGRFWQIGGHVSNKYVNWNTDGLRYTVRITGLEMNHAIKLSYERKKELIRRIESGQSFHTMQ